MSIGASIVRAHDELAIITHCEGHCMTLYRILPKYSPQTGVRAYNDKWGPGREVDAHWTWPSQEWGTEPTGHATNGGPGGRWTQGYIRSGSS